MVTFISLSIATVCTCLLESCAGWLEVPTLPSERRIKIWEQPLFIITPSFNLHFCFLSDFLVITFRFSKVHPAFKFPLGSLFCFYTKVHKQSWWNLVQIIVTTVSSHLVKSVCIIVDHQFKQQICENIHFYMVRMFAKLTGSLLWHGWVDLCSCYYNTLIQTRLKTWRFEPY